MRNGLVTCHEGCGEVAPMSALWHRAYCRWYDADRAGHRRRAAAWGWVADRLAGRA